MVYGSQDALPVTRYNTPSILPPLLRDWLATDSAAVAGDGALFWKVAAGVGCFLILFGSMLRVQGLSARFRHCCGEGCRGEWPDASSRVERRVISLDVQPIGGGTYS